MSVAKKIQAVMKDVGYIQKDGQMQGGGNYKYLSEEKITAELHKACAEHGLVVYPVAMAIIDEREDTTSSNKIMHNVRILVSYRFIDSDEPESTLDATAFGEASDMGDKVLNKCMTAAYKYALRQTFMISTGDDPDHEPSAESTKSEKRKPTPKAKPADSDTVACEWPGCDNHVKATERYSLEKLVEWSKEKCEGQVFCYHHKQKWEAGERPANVQSEPMTPEQEAQHKTMVDACSQRAKDLKLSAQKVVDLISGIEPGKKIVELTIPGLNRLYEAMEECAKKEQAA